MSDLLNASLTFPTIVFTILVGVSLALWLLTVLGVLDLDGGEVDGLLDGLFDALNLTGAPPLAVFTSLSVSGWFVTVLGQLLILGSVSGTAALLGGLILFVVAVAVALVASMFIARPLGRLLETADADTANHFVGREAVVRSTRVTDDFGRAEVHDDQGAVLTVQVRSTLPNELADGATVRLLAWNEADHTYLIDIDATSPTKESSE